MQTTILYFFPILNRINIQGGVASQSNNSLFAKSFFASLTHFNCPFHLPEYYPLPVKKKNTNIFKHSDKKLNQQKTVFCLLLIDKHVCIRYSV
jgi:hypothetical protein